MTNRCEEKKEALETFLKDTQNVDKVFIEAEYENPKYNNVYMENLFITDFGEFLVVTDEEATKAHEEDMENFIDDLGIEGFTSPEYIYDNFCEWSDGEDYMHDSYESYYSDIESENASHPLFENRLQEELFEIDFPKIRDEYDSIKENLQDKECEDYKNWFNSYEDNKDDLIESAIESIIDGYDSPLEWASLNFGKDFIKTLSKQGELKVDIPALSKWVASMDGRGNSLARWDGCENEEGDFYIYQQDNNDYSKEQEEEIEHE